MWPSARARVRGQALQPLHKSAVAAAEKLPQLGELLAIVDSLRAGDVRVRSVAAEMLAKTMRGELE